MIEKLRQKIDEKNSEIIEALSHAGSVKAKLQRYDTMLEQIQIRRSELNQRLLLLKSEAVSRKEQMAAYAQENRLWIIKRMSCRGN